LFVDIEELRVAARKLTALLKDTKIIWFSQTSDHLPHDYWEVEEDGDLLDSSISGRNSDTLQALWVPTIGSNKLSV
jgi:hypothetical protein